MINRSRPNCGCRALAARCVRFRSTSNVEDLVGFRPPTCLRLRDSKIETPGFVVRRHDPFRHVEPCAVLALTRAASARASTLREDETPSPSRRFES